MIKSKALKDSITTLVIDGVTIDKDREVIYPSYRAMNADGDCVIDSGYDISGEEYGMAKAAVDDAIMDVVKTLPEGEKVDAFAIIESVMYVGALRRLGFDLK